MLYAVIDIGSNAARLLFANALVLNNSIYVEKASLVRIPLRLGNDVFTIGKISNEKLEDFVKTMRAFKLLIEVYKPEGVKICATAAMREAENQQEVLQEIYTRTGIEIEVISGKEEADLIRDINKLSVINDSYPSVYVDVGGGSTEISIELPGKEVKLKSFNIGTIKLLTHNFPENVWQDIYNWLSILNKYNGKCNLIGSGGNINKINKMYGNEKSKLLSYDKLNAAYKQLSKLSIEERMASFGFRIDRADVIVPAAEIFIKIMKFIHAKHIIVPKTGLSDGFVHRLYQNHLLATQSSLQPAGNKTKL
ncbi:MAG: Ppx/GppA family phosphatase [Bacteroidales bacterium]|nr:Ppx/GppA family phosphatase [Bacteroidales bacterium]